MTTPAVAMPVAARVIAIGLASADAFAAREARARSAGYEIGSARRTDLNALAVIASEGPIGPADLAIHLWPGITCDMPARSILKRLHDRGLVLVVEERRPQGRFEAGGGRKFTASEAGRVALQKGTEAGR